MKSLSLPVCAFALGACASPPDVPNIASAPYAEIAVRSSPNTSIMVYSSAPSAFALRGGEMKVRSDTIRAITPVNLTAFLNAGDIYVASAERVPIEVQARLTGAPALRLGASGLRVVLESGGAGIR
jgi:hypothetical protein